MSWKQYMHICSNRLLSHPKKTTPKSFIVFQSQLKPLPHGEEVCKKLGESYKTATCGLVCTFVPSFPSDSPIRRVKSTGWKSKLLKVTAVEMVTVNLAEMVYKSENMQRGLFLSQFKPAIKWKHLEWRLKQCRAQFRLKHWAEYG